MCGCKCTKFWGILLLLIGIGYLFVDLGWWSFWGIGPMTMVFLFAGLWIAGCSMCKCGESCGTCCTEEKAPVKKKK